MPVPPPPPPGPPPPSGPPPPPAMGGLKLGGGRGGGGPDPRSALLSSIQKGAKLKKVVTVDKSAPVIAGKVSNVNSLSTNRTITNNGGSNAPVAGNNGMQKLGGIFEGMSTMPVLKPVGGRGPTSNTTPTNRSPPNEQTAQNVNNSYTNNGPPALDFNAELTKHLTLKKQKKAQQPASNHTSTTQSNQSNEFRINRGPPPQPPAQKVPSPDVQQRSDRPTAPAVPAPILHQSTDINSSSLFKKQQISTSTTNGYSSSATNDTSPSMPIANKSSLFQQQLATSLETQKNNSISSNNTSNINNSSLSSINNSLTNVHQLKPVPNHGKPNCAPKPPGIQNIIASKNGNGTTVIAGNKPTVSRHHSMKTPRINLEPQPQPPDVPRRLDKSTPPAMPAPILHQSTVLNSPFLFNEPQIRINCGLQPTSPDVPQRLSRSTPPAMPAPILQLSTEYNSSSLFKEQHIRSPPVTLAGAPVFPSSQHFGTMRGPPQMFQSQESIHKNPPIGRPTVAPPRPPNIKPPPPPTPIRSISNTNLTNLPLSLPSNGPVANSTNFGSVSNVSTLKKQLGNQLHQMVNSGSVNDVSSTQNHINNSNNSHGGSNNNVSNEKSLNNGIAPPLPPHRQCPAPPPPMRQNSNSAISSTAAPVPPQRHSSIRNSNSSSTTIITQQTTTTMNSTAITTTSSSRQVNRLVLDLERKFSKNFHNVTEFRAPPPFTELPKSYPSRNLKSINAELRKPKAPSPPIKPQSKLYLDLTETTCTTSPSSQTVADDKNYMNTNNNSSVMSSETSYC